MYLDSIIFKHGKDDLELWMLDIPLETEDKLMEILNEYIHRGCSVRGTKRDIANEIMEI